jgi:hypothetical protein
MNITDLLNQRSYLLLSRGRLLNDHRCIDWAIKQGIYDIGVTNQTEKDLLDGYLIVEGLNLKVFVCPSYCYCNPSLKDRKPLMQATVPYKNYSSLYI